MVTETGQTPGAIYQITDTTFRSNTYICTIGDADHCIVIDPSFNIDAISLELKHLSLRPTMIFCTHGHFDHAGSAATLQKQYNIPVFLHPSDLKVMKSSNFLLKAFRSKHKFEQPQITEVSPNFEIDLGSEHLRYVHTPGHTDGSCIIEFGRALFTGDTIFSRGVGLSRLPGENSDVLRQSILRYWKNMTEGNIVFPGHGSSLSASSVKSSNLALRKFLGLDTAGSESQGE